MKHELDYKSSPVSRALVQVGNLLGEEFAKKAAENVKVKYDSAVDHFWAMEQAMKRNEDNQPLGVLVAEELEKRNIPFVLATSTYHHDVLTQPIQDYCSKRGWQLIDCNPNNEHEKATPEFWERCYNSLEIRLKQVNALRGMTITNY